jgi:uncharacterized protein YidB (DUF937 family)
MNTHTMGVRATMAAALCVASLGFAACGGDDDSSSDSADSGATGASGSEETVGDLVRGQMEAAGISDEDADCVVDKINETVSEEDLQEVIDQAEEGGDSAAAGSEGLGPAFTAAVQDCGVTAQP